MASGAQYEISGKEGCAGEEREGIVTYTRAASGIRELELRI